GNTDTFSGVISGPGGMTFAGTGITTLTNTNPYTGGTTVAAGTLDVANGGALGDGALAVAGGAIANLDNVAQTITDMNGTGPSI
ncbi:autotransporter-associated beta strand repeat-containing protein, partial [Acidithiobacillus sp. MC6.1]|nr:autotransporter-associated beta strand repeat-containing protein [Acidithiobacillus sp. MC6.1]